MNFDKAGKTYKPTKYEAGLEKIKEYAIAIDDHNPLYVDEEYAKKSKYKSIVAPPTFAVVYQKDSIGPILFDPQLDVNLPMLVHGEQEFEFYRVVKPNDVIWSTAKIKNMFEKDNKEFLIAEIDSRLGSVDGEPVCKGTYTFIVRKF